MKEVSVLIFRALLCMGASLAFTILVNFLLGEAIVYWYMQSHGINVRADLSEDMGLGMISFFSSLLSAPLIFSFTFWILWKKTRNILSNDN